VWATLGVHAIGVAALTSCIATPPPVASVSSVDRLDALDRPWPGLEQPVDIVFDERLIPSIRAGDERDAAYTLGLVHAHLRLAQMDLIRRVASARIAESLGPVAAPIDLAIRAIDLDRAVPAMEERLPDATRVWIERYVEGVNAYRSALRARPADHRALNLNPKEDWSVEDVLRIGRLAGVDINWGRWVGLLRQRDAKGFNDYLARLRAFADAGLPSFGPQEPTPLDPIMQTGKTGSNAIVVAGSRAASSGALMASDPHLGLPQPNLWCIVGYRTPDLNVVGLTIPGLPFVLVGRNEHIAWTGTNMQSASSVLYNLPDGFTEIGAREERIRTRWWFDSSGVIRESEHGPVVSDAPILASLAEGPVAMRWRGHDPSDEATTFYKLARATNWDDFRSAFATYAVGGQNFLYADREGAIGQVLALDFVPAAGRAALMGAVDPADPRFAWGDAVSSLDLPSVFNPEEGFLVSANNVPILTDPVLVPQGNANDRIVRMTERLEGEVTVTLRSLEDLQRDVYSRASHDAARLLSAAIGDRALGAPEAELAAALRDWDGHYRAASPGAVAYQRLIRHLIDLAYQDRYAVSLRRTLRNAPYVHDFIAQDLRDGFIDAPMVRRALAQASIGYEKTQVWGDIHRLRLAHPIGNVPLLGSPYVFAEHPVGGSTTTIAKTAHTISEDPHTVTFGANARIVADMGTLDENYVALLGGQDGWLGSDRLLDQVDLWLEGRLTQLPMRVETQDARAVRTLHLSPPHDRLKARAPSESP
jgi:penicillin amidase